MQIEYSKNFIKTFKKSPQKIKESFKDRLRIFINNPHNQILNNHRLSGKLENYRSINISGNWRAIFKEIKDKNSVYFIVVGTHSQLYS